MKAVKSEAPPDKSAAAVSVVSASNIAAALASCCVGVLSDLLLRTVTSNSTI